ncbi:hypothetical protein T439DRAFT_354871 [Meredithblackwellia eburnea MCA 4105]
MYALYQGVGATASGSLLLILMTSAELRSELRFWKWWEAAMAVFILIPPCYEAVLFAVAGESSGSKFLDRLLAGGMLFTSFSPLIFMVTLVAMNKGWGWMKGYQELAERVEEEPPASGTALGTALELLPIAARKSDDVSATTDPTQPPGVGYWLNIWDQNIRIMVDEY